MVGKQSALSTRCPAVAASTAGAWMRHRSAHAGKRINPVIYLRPPVPGDLSETRRNCVARDVDLRFLRVSLVHRAAATRGQILDMYAAYIDVMCTN
ncbi:hypothetical protein VTO73DRAFT_11152 [Trametes versicolor]